MVERGGSVGPVDEQQLGPVQIEQGQATAARLAVCARAVDAADARQLLLALGLLPPPRPRRN